MVALYVALIINSRRTFSQVPAKFKEAVKEDLAALGLDENGNPVKGIKRHPDIGNHVVIYANATILGGNTVIGDHCVIGGNVWLTHSVPPGQKIYYTGGQ